MVNILQITLFMSIFGYTWCITCSEVTDCITCVSMKSWIPLIDVNCRWCPLSGTCHAYGSLANTCSLSTSVTKTAFCYEKRYGEYDPENAYINAMLSAVAYSDHPRKCFDKMFPRGGFKLVKAIGKRCEYLFEYRECFAVVAVSDRLKLIVIAYRGTTDGTQLAEEIGTFILPNQQFVAGGTVHRYFYDAFNELYPCARIHMRKLIASKPKYDVLVTGHSLGAAMASLMAASLVYDNPKLEQRMYLYTFGMPRLGDQTYAVTHDRLVNNSWRVIHYKDFVTRVPPRAVGNFHHKTEVYYDVENMLPDSPYTICSSNEDPKCSVQHVLNPLDYANYINYHTHYFSIQLGQVCKSLGAGRRRRSEDGEEMSAMSHLFNNETCKVIEFDDVTSGQRGIHLAPQLLVAVSVVFFIVVLA